MEFAWVDLSKTNFRPFQNQFGMLSTKTIIDQPDLAFRHIVCNSLNPSVSKHDVHLSLDPFRMIINKKSGTAHIIEQGDGAFSRANASFDVLVDAKLLLDFSRYVLETRNKLARGTRKQNTTNTAGRSKTRISTCGETRKIFLITDQSQQGTKRVFVQSATTSKLSKKPRTEAQQNSIESFRP
jgi:hypothetical protein